MSIKLCQAAGSVVTPIDDARLYSWIANRTVGIVSGCVVTSAGTNQLSITAGWGICQGHVFVISAETISAAVASSGTMLGRLLIHIDTSDSTTPVKFVTQAASTLPSLTQEAIDGSGSIYEIPLVTYSVGTISISDLTSVAPSAITSSQKLSTARKIGNASFDGTADTTLAQIGVLGSMCFTELWVNPNPTADFAAQTIAIPRSSYDTLAITSENGFLLLDKDSITGRIVGMYISGTGNSVATLMTRDFSFSATSITFNDCKALTSPWASGTTKIQNELNIPKRIYGVNFAKEV